MPQQLIFDGNVVKLAIARIQEFEHLTDGKGYYLAFSGGKDSVCIKALADMAGVKYDAHYRICPDPPELIQFIKKYYPDVQRDRPAMTMWQGIVKKGFPMRRARWCCEYLKEGGGDGRIILTGVRWAESAARLKRHGLVTPWVKGAKRKTLINPIIDWTDRDVWDFIHSNNIPYCSLYDEGWKRLGCLLCPLSSNVLAEARRWPKYADAYRRAFHRLYNRHPRLPSKWSSADAMFDAWINGRKKMSDNKQDDCELFAGAGMAAPATYCMEKTSHARLDTVESF